MVFDSPRASFEQVLEFANAVREAGGGNPIDALMPAVPADSHRCLVARNLNFNCTVSSPAHVDEHGSPRWPAYPDGSDAWSMAVDSEDLQQKIADAFGLETGYRYGGWSCVPRFLVVLPQEIAQVAVDFDAAMEHIQAKAQDEDLVLDEEHQKLVNDMLPYIEASIKEAHSIGTSVVYHADHRATVVADAYSGAESQVSVGHSVITEEGTLVL